MLRIAPEIWILLYVAPQNNVSKGITWLMREEIKAVYQWRHRVYDVTIYLRWDQYQYHTDSTLHMHFKPCEFRLLKNNRYEGLYHMYAFQICTKHFWCNFKINNQDRLAMIYQTRNEFALFFIVYSSWPWICWPKWIHKVFFFLLVQLADSKCGRAPLRLLARSLLTSCATFPTDIR